MCRSIKNGKTVMGSRALSITPQTAHRVSRLIAGYASVSSNMRRACIRRCRSAFQCIRLEMAQFTFRIRTRQRDIDKKVHFRRGADHQDSLLHNEASNQRVLELLADIQRPGYIVTLPP